MAGFIRRIVVVIAVVLLGTGCGDDDPAPAVDYLLVAGVHQIGADGWIALIDCKTDSIIDSLGYPGMLGLSFMWGSPKGDFLLAGEAGRQSRVWDLRSRSQLTEIPGPHDALFVPDTEVVVTTSVSLTRVYSLPEFELDTALEMSLLSLSRMRESRSVAAVLRRGPPDVLGDISQLIVFGLTENAITDSFYVTDVSGSVLLQIKHLQISNDGKRAYVIGRAPGGSPLVSCYAISEKRTVFQATLAAATGVCRQSPDGTELWVTDPGYAPIFGEPIWPGQVLVLNAATGAVIDTIPTLGLDEDPNARWWVDDIQFVPGLNKAYVNCKGRPVLVIDTRTKEVTGMIFGDSGRSAFSIAVVPRY